VASSYGQANYYFDTYDNSSGVPEGVVTWSSTPSLAPAGEAGVAVTTADGVFADLLWNDGTRSGDLGLAVQTQSFPGFGDGWIKGPVTYSFDPLYVANTPITFTIEVWQGASYATGTANGSETFVDPGQTGGATQSPDLFVEPGTPITIALVVPEPTTLALAGLGAAGLLMFRKRQ